MFNMMEVDELTRLRMIFTWNVSPNDDKTGTEVRKLVKISQRLMDKDYRQFTQRNWWFIFDSLRNFPERNEYEEKLYQLAKGKYKTSEFYDEK